MVHAQNQGCWNDWWWVWLQTTLMDVLAGRKTGGLIEGDITIQVLFSTAHCCLRSLRVTKDILDERSVNEVSRLSCLLSSDCHHRFHMSVGGRRPSW